MKKNTKTQKRLEEFRAKHPEVFEKFEKKNGANSKSNPTKPKVNR